MTPGDGGPAVLDGYGRLAERMEWWRAVAVAAAGIPTWPPAVSDGTQHFFVGDLDYRIEPRGTGFDVVKQERAQTQVVAGFERFEDVEKYLVWIAGDHARDLLGLPSLDMDWYQRGMDPRVEASQTGFRRTLRLPGVPDSAATLRETDAVVFSHVLPLSMDELEAALRAGVPEPPPAA